MKRFYTMLLLLAASECAAFSNHNHHYLMNQRPSPHTTFLAADNNNKEQPPPNLVDKTEFVAAMKTLQTEIAKANGMAASAQQEEPSMYAIGRLTVQLSLDEPGLDLSDNDGAGLVLVSGVSEKTAQQSGIQFGDTIVGIRVAGSADFQNCQARSLEETGGMLQAAAMHAVQNGQTTIELELNRLMKCYYADEEE